MTATFSGFISFVRGAALRFFQERELGLDLYLSGLSAWLPAALAVAAATVFLLGIFHVAPKRSRSVPILFGIGAIAFLSGLVGAWGNYSRAVAEVPADDSGPAPARILIEGRGAKPATEAQRAALLCLPLYLGSAVLAGSAALGLFLLIFGGQERADPPRAKAGGQLRLTGRSAD